MRIIIKIQLLLLILLFSIKGYASDEWQFEFTPFIWATDLETTVGLNGLVVDSSVEFDDLVDMTNIAWMSIFEGHKGQWGFYHTIIYMEVSETVNAGRTAQIGDLAVGTLTGELEVDVTEAYSNLALTYYPKQIDHLMIYAGIRYHKTETELNLGATGSLTIHLPGGGTQVFTRSTFPTIKQDDDWSQPLIGFRYQIPFNSQWHAGIIADYSLDGDDNTYSFILGLGYKISDAITVKLGYRQDEIEYEQSGYVFERKSTGAIAGATFKF